MLVVEAARVARRLGRPAAEEDRMGGCQGSSTVATPPEVDAPGAIQKSGRPAMEGDRRGESRPAWPMGEAAGQRAPPPRNRAASEWCQSRGQGRGAMRFSRHCREGQGWWCRCRSRHCRRRRRGFRGCLDFWVGGVAILEIC
jgi:hypothetical protein